MIFVNTDWLPLFFPKMSNIKTGEKLDLPCRLASWRSWRRVHRRILLESLWVWACGQANRSRRSWTVIEHHRRWVYQRPGLGMFCWMGSSLKTGQPDEWCYSFLDSLKNITFYNLHSLMCSSLFALITAFHKRIQMIQNYYATFVMSLGRIYQIPEFVKETRRIITYSGLAVRLSLVNRSTI